MPEIIETFALSFGEAGQAAGTVTLDSQILTLRGVAGTTYQIDATPGSDFRDGLFSVEHVSSGTYPIYQAQIGAVDSGESYLGLNAGTYALQALTVTDDVATATFRVTIDGTDRVLTVTIDIVGEAVRLRFQGSGSTSYASNFNGLYAGAFSGPGLATIELPGTAAFPTAFNTAAGATLWLGHFLDIYQSAAQGFVLTDPTGGSLNANYTTANRYEKNTAGVLPSDLDETIWGIGSIDDRNAVRVHSNAASDKHTRAAATRVFVTSIGDGLATNQTRLTDLADEWGFEDSMVFLFYWWILGNYPSLGQNNGGSIESGDAGIATLGAAVTAAGLRFAPYTYATLEKVGTANYDASRRVLDADGGARDSTFAAGTFLCRPEDLAAKFEAQMGPTGANLAATISATDLFADVDTFVSPFAGGGGNFVNADATSDTQTLATAAREMRRAFYAIRATTSGMLQGEGPRGGHMNAFAIGLEGCVDSVEAAWVTNEPLEETDAGYEDGRSPAQWPMDLEEAWNRRGKAAQDGWTHPDRLFTIHEAGLQVAPYIGQLYPYSRAMIDLRRCLQLMTRRPGEVYLAETWSQKHAEREVVKEEYIVTAACKRAAALYATDAVVTYHDATEGYETFDERFTREDRGADGMRETRARIVVGTLTYWINRGDTDWTIPASEVGLSSNGITLPTNGYLMTDSSDGALFSSFEVGATANNRVDVVHIPGVRTLVDGRGVELSVFGVTSTGGRMVMVDYEGGFTLTEQEDETVVRSTTVASTPLTDYPRARTALGRSRANTAIG